MNKLALEIAKMRRRQAWRTWAILCDNAMLYSRLTGNPLSIPKMPDAASNPEEK